MSASGKSDSGRNDSASEECDSDVFEVERIMLHKRQGNTEWYLIKWSNFDLSQIEWKTKESVQQCSLIVSLFEDYHKLDYYPF